MKVLIADRLEPRSVDALRSAACEVTYEPALEGPALREAIARTACEVLIVRGTPVTEQMLDASRNLSLVVRAGAGVETIDIQAASKRSILVASCPGRSAVAIAELTFALILALDRRLVDGVNDLRNGLWNKKKYCQARGLKGRTLGIVGMGQVGVAVARRAQAFEMDVVAWSRSLTYERAGGLGLARCESPADVAARCDILSIHLAAAPETEKIIGPDVLSHLKPGGYVINTACPEVLDYEALVAAISERGLRVGLDIFPAEPRDGNGQFTHAILKAGGVVYGTPHIGASTDQSQEAIAAETVRIVKVFQETGQVPNVVNLAKKTPATHSLIVRQKDKPGVLAAVFSKLAGAGINVQETENVVFDGAEAAIARINVDKAPSAALLAEIRAACADVLELNVVALG